MAGKIKKTTTAPNILTRTLILIGKPFYFILSHILIAIIYIFYITGKLIILPFKIKYANCLDTVSILYPKSKDI